MDEQDKQPQVNNQYDTNSTESSSESDEVVLRITLPEKSTFQSTFGTVISCLGCAVGTGNIWRFPRILAAHSYSTGSLSFFLAWAIILFLWSIPVTLIEYGIGRFTKNSPPVACYKFFGKYFIWIGFWFVGTVFFLSAYYAVIIGWCLYYLYISCTLPSLPDTEEASLELFKSFAEFSYWPVLCQFLAVLLTGIFLFGGINLIEKANSVLVPLLLLILVFTFGWSMTRQYAEIAIVFLFTPTWNSLADPSLWVAAAGQNAFDTGAGRSSLMTYATYMGRSSNIVKYSLLIPVMNNLVSLYASITIFSTVFSTLVQTDGAITRSAILQLLQNSGPGSTGLTFTWIPVLFSKVGIFGRVLCALFFLCLTVAGISSLLSDIQVYILTMKEIGVPHKVAVTCALLACVLAGLPSAMKLEFLENQDDTWGYALIVSGLLLSIIVIVYRPMRFRKVILNDYGTADWKVPSIWIISISVLIPTQAAVLLVWWVYDYIRSDQTGFQLTFTSVSVNLLEWFILVIILLSANMIAICVKQEFYKRTRKIGSDPYDPLTYENDKLFLPKGIRLEPSVASAVYLNQ